MQMWTWMMGRRRQRRRMKQKELRRQGRKRRPRMSSKGEPCARQPAAANCKHQHSGTLRRQSRTARARRKAVMHTQAGAILVVVRARFLHWSCASQSAKAGKIVLCSAAVQCLMTTFSWLVAGCRPRLISCGAISFV
ncbi:hypothetical protein DUNSADRAFT_11588 [Dunaliella salina]|uniref:Encoded protein n=1 Tax=Dunaliella salina TaxID=3046 RepID=A0ABQ7GCZ8_DUNSA|nr:hypothetical protein DUNSADRAFT_11588 [Dunaliella salina]|eukprot:KAF5832488.1 hypothetical protein DUNSADRAFT_11588 [Dunaliella salina]